MKEGCGSSDPVFFQRKKEGSGFSVGVHILTHHPGSPISPSSPLKDVLDQVRDLALSWAYIIVHEQATGKYAKLV